MKHRIYYYIFLILSGITVLCFSACNRLTYDDSSVQLENKTETLSETTDIDRIAEEYFNSYYCYGTHPLFDEQVKKNRIDSAYLEETSEIQTRSDLEGCERKYTKLWKEELEFSVSELCKVTDTVQGDDTKQAVFGANEAMEQLLNFEYSLRSTEYEGHEMMFHRLYEEKEWYRNMTMRIKYITFSLSSKDNPEYKTVWKYQEVNQNT